MSADFPRDKAGPRLGVECCRGEPWSRSGFDRHTRGIIKLSMLPALNRPKETRLHMRGAIDSNEEQKVIMETFLQNAVYFGVPAARYSMKVAAEMPAKEAGKIFGAS